MQVVTHIEVLALIGTGAQILDVLPPHEYRSAHIRGALHLPLSRLWREARTAVALERPIVTYCRDSL